MIDTVTQTEFIDRFRQSSTCANDFSYDGLIALFEHKEDFEASIGEQLNFDHIEISCDYTEFKTLDEAKANYQKYDDIEEWGDFYKYTNEVIPIDNYKGENLGCIIRNF